MADTANVVDLILEQCFVDFAYEEKLRITQKGRPIEVMRQKTVLSALSVL